MSKWVKDKIGNVSDSFAGGTPSRSRPDYFNGEIPWISSSEVNLPYIDDTKEKITELGLENSSAKWIPKNSVLVAMYGATAGVVSKLLINATSNQAVLALVPDKDKIDGGFLYYQVKQNKEGILFLAQGSGQPNLSKDLIDNYEINFPISVPEQRQIATILSTADAVIEKTQAAIAKYKAIKQGMLQDLFTRGMMSEKVKVKSEKGAEEKTIWKLRPSYQDAPELYKESKLGWIPKVWKVERIDKLCQITTGNKDTQNKLEYGEYPFFVRSQTIEKINSYSYDGEAILTAGDGVGGGKIYHYINGKFDFHQRVYMLYGFEKIITPKYLFYYFSTNFLAEVDRCSAKTTVDSVRMEMIAGMIVPLPNISEQISIADKLITLESKLKTEQDFLHKQQQIKAGLMNDLLSGKVKVKSEKLGKSEKLKVEN